VKGFGLACPSRIMASTRRASRIRRVVVIQGRARCPGRGAAPKAVPPRNEEGAPEQGGRSDLPGHASALRPPDPVWRVATRSAFCAAERATSHAPFA